MQVENVEALDTVTARFFKGLGDPIRLRILEFTSWNWSRLKQGIAVF